MVMGAAMSAPDTTLESATGLVRFEAKLFHLWVAHQSSADRGQDRRRVSGALPKLALRDRVTAGTRIEPSDPEIAAYLKRRGAG